MLPYYEGGRVIQYVKGQKKIAISIEAREHNNLLSLSQPLSILLDGPNLSGKNAEK